MDLEKGEGMDIKKLKIGCGVPDWGSSYGKELKTGRGLGLIFELSKFEML